MITAITGLVTVGVIALAVAIAAARRSGGGRHRA